MHTKIFIALICIHVYIVLNSTVTVNDSNGNNFFGFACSVDNRFCVLMSTVIVKAIAVYSIILI